MATAAQFPRLAPGHEWLDRAKREGAGRNARGGGAAPAWARMPAMSF